MKKRVLVSGLGVVVTTSALIAACDSGEADDTTPPPTNLPADGGVTDGTSSVKIDAGPKPNKFSCEPCSSADTCDPNQAMGYGSGLTFGTFCNADGICAPKTPFACRELDDECPLGFRCVDYGNAKLCRCANEDASVPVEEFDAGSDAGEDAGEDAGGDAGDAGDAGPTTPSPYGESTILPGAGSGGSNGAALATNGELWLAGFKGKTASVTTLFPNGTVKSAFTVTESGASGELRFGAIRLPTLGGAFVAGAHTSNLRPVFGEISPAMALEWLVADDSASLSMTGLAVRVPGPDEVIGAFGGDTLYELPKTGASATKSVYASGASTISFSAIAPFSTGFVLAGSITTGGNKDILVMTTDATGAPATALSIGGAGADTATGVAVAPDGVYVTGTTTPAVGPIAIALVKLGAQANSITWQKTFSFVGTGFSGGVGVVGTDVVMVGGAPTQMMAARLDGTGNVSSIRSFGSITSNWVGRTAFAGPTGVLMTGGTPSQDPFVLGTTANLTVPGCADPAFAGTDISGLVTVANSSLTTATPAVTRTSSTPALTPVTATIATATATATDNCK